MSLSFLLLVLAVLALAVFLLAEVGTWLVWTALVLAVVSAVVSATRNDRAVG